MKLLTNKSYISLSSLILVLSSCNNCDCSYENYNRIKLNMKKEYVNKILKTSPTSEIEIIDNKRRREIFHCSPRSSYKKISKTNYKCVDNIITIYYVDEFVAIKSFNE